MLATRLSPNLKKLSANCPFIARQFVPSELETADEENVFDDPLMEEEHTVTRGLVYKYGNRALVLLTMNCAAYCRFCTRRRKVSDIEKGIITDKDLENIRKYLLKNKQIKELIFSGGDPLTVPPLLKKAIKKLAALPQIKIIRVGTRLHLSNPAAVNKGVIDALKQVKNKPLYLMVHFEHPAELTKPVIAAIKRLQSVSTMLFSQSVSLKGVNDDEETLYKLFTSLIEIGVKPYYHYRCDPVKGAEHFIMDFDKEIEMMTNLRKRLSGLAMPLYIIDSPNGSGKVPVPLNFWKFDRSNFKDFNGKKLELL
ncbi:MAG TPA: radical SAM protein [Patescibacteria group bacterium]|nr:radical SAM protein [Patescibacteria group bacterium]